jgi:hypothetical protein
MGKAVDAHARVRLLSRFLQPFAKPKGGSFGGFVHFDTALRKRQFENA